MGKFGHRVSACLSCSPFTGPVPRRPGGLGTGTTRPRSTSLFLVPCARRPEAQGADPRVGMRGDGAERRAGRSGVIGPLRPTPANQRGAVGKVRGPGRRSLKVCSTPCLGLSLWRPGKGASEWRCPKPLSPGGRLNCTSLLGCFIEG